MIQVRTSMFETNSSSTHSLILCTDETYQKYVAHELFADWENEKFVPIETLRKYAKDVIDPEDRWHRSDYYPTSEEIDAMDERELILLLDKWCVYVGGHNIGYSGVHRKMTLPSGEEVHGISAYYCD